MTKVWNYILWWIFFAVERFLSITKPEVVWNVTRLHPLTPHAPWVRRCSRPIILDSKAQRFGGSLNYLVWVPAEVIFVFVSSVLSFGFLSIRGHPAEFKDITLAARKNTFVSVVKLRKITIWRVWSNKIVIYSHVISCCSWRHKTGFFKWRTLSH